VLVERIRFVGKWKQQSLVANGRRRRKNNAESNMRCNARLIAAFCLLTAVMSSAATKNIRFRITVLDAQSKALNTNPDQPTRDCDLANYSGYCHESKVASVRNTMRVQEGNGKPFAITCVWDNHWSKCVALPIGQTFDARRDKHGITIFYENEKGGASKELYTVVEAAQVPKPAATSGLTQSSPAAAANAASPAQAEAPATVEVNRDKVKCNFSSTPPGAEITLDGRFVGNTPSTIGVSTGTHVVVLFMPGFAQWKRELAVAAGSEVNVTASLQKTQP
jgi:PEGA domain